MDIDIESIEDALRDALIGNDDIRQYSKSIKTGDYEVPSGMGIEVFIHGGIPTESDNSRVLFGSVYTIPIDITMLCRYRRRDDLTKDLNNLCSEITRVIYKSGKIASTNGYRLPIDVTDVVIGEGENPEAYAVTITVLYEMILVPA